jgi:hypothetical protein
MTLPAIILSALSGYVLSVAVETPVLLACLSRRHPLQDRLFAGVWLTACSYPVVSLVIPLIIDPRQYWIPYLCIAETFAPLSECIVFWLAFGEKAEWGRRSFYQDMGAIVLANLCSFATGLWFPNLRLLG